MSFAVSFLNIVLLLTSRVAGHPLAQNERCLHMFLQDEHIDKNYTPSKIRNAQQKDQTSNSCDCPTWFYSLYPLHVTICYNTCNKLTFLFLICCCLFQSPIFVFIKAHKSVLSNSNALYDSKDRLDSALFCPQYVFVL